MFELGQVGEGILGPSPRLSVPGVVEMRLPCRTAMFRREEGTLSPELNESQRSVFFSLLGRKEQQRGAESYTPMKRSGINVKWK